MACQNLACTRAHYQTYTKKHTVISPRPSLNLKALFEKGLRRRGRIQTQLAMDGLRI